MRLAQIEAGIVTNIARGTSGQDIPIGWVAAVDHCGIGWSYDGATFTAPAVVPMSLAQEQALMRCTRQQGKLALGPSRWAQVLDLLANPDPSWDPATLWALQVAIEDTIEWRRLDPDMQVLIWAMNLTPQEADEIFRRAMTL